MKIFSVPFTFSFLFREKKEHLWLEILAKWECTQCPYLVRLWSKYEMDFILSSCVFFEYATNLVMFWDKTPSLNSGILDQNISVEYNHL